MNRDTPESSRRLPHDLEKFCVIDVGSTTTKAILFKRDPDWRFFRREAPTTVEKPEEDVTCGVLNALRELEQLTGENLLRDNVPCLPLFSTSSAGGGLAIVVAGLVGHVTTKSAERVALGAGAMIQEVLALDDGRTPYKKIEILETLRPDMLLLAGGFDGGAVSGPVFLAELFNQADLRPKLSPTGKLPVIYAGNVEAREYVAETLSERFIYRPVANLRPGQKQENLEPARDAIHEVFMEHVMSRAPGYERYSTWVSAPILPTPAAVSKLLALVSQHMAAKILAIDIGGATTDIFTAENGEVFRTVSANLGMSYSILNVVRQAGLPAIHDLLDFDISPAALLDRIGNKFLQPTALPRTVEDTKIECAVASIAIREAVREHLRVQRGFSISRGEEELSWHYLKRKKETGKTEAEIPAIGDYDLIIGSGGKLSHSPRETAALMLLHALQPEKSIALGVDSAFMFPHLGVLAEQSPTLALELFNKLGLIRLGQLIVPTGKPKPGTEALHLTGATDQGQTIAESVACGEVRFVYLPEGERAEIDLESRQLKPDIRHLTHEASAGALIIDGCGRPASLTSKFVIPDDYALPVREIESPPPSRMEQGKIRIRRELAIPGQVLVKPGEIVSSETIVAKSTRTFLRPFFLRVTDTLGVPPTELPSFLLKKVGDEVAVREVIARNDANFWGRKIFRSPVAGTVEKILPNGTVIVREHLEYMAKSSTVNAARELAVKPAELERWMKCDIGEEVEMGQTIAAIGSPTGKKHVAFSPIRGKIKEINLQYGVVIIKPLLEELQLTAWLPGSVMEVSAKGCVVDNAGTTIHGVWGRGGQVAGIVAGDTIDPGHIVVRETTTTDDLARLQGMGIAALLTGGLPLHAFNELNPPFAVVVTEGFGDRRMDPGVYDTLVKHRGKMAVVDATTQLRAGVIRPRVILPDNS